MMCDDNAEKYELTVSQYNNDINYFPCAILIAL